MIRTKDNKLIGFIKQYKNGNVIIKFGFEPKTNDDLEYVMFKLGLKNYGD